MSAVPILFLLFDSVIKLMKIDAVVKGLYRVIEMFR